VVFYCVIVDEDGKPSHQGCQSNKKNDEKVFFYVLTNNLGEAQ